MSGNLFAQYDSVCVTQDSNAPDPAGVYSYATDSGTLALFPQRLFRIHFWVLLEDNDITDMDNPNYTGVTENDVLESIALINQAFNQFQLFFKYDGVSVINDSSLALLINEAGQTASCQIADWPNHTPYGQALSYINSQANNPDVVKPDMFNMYIMKQGICFGGVAFGNRKRQMVSKNGLTKLNVVHEIAHSLGLRHTRGGEGNDYDPGECEHVTRDETLLEDPNDSLVPYFNARTRGDYVVDTGAIPDFYPNTAPYNYDPATCSYIGDATDCQGSQYVIFPEDMMNAMGNAHDGDCTQAIFTFGQGIRMQETITGSSNLSAMLASDLSPLYEPYKGIYYNSGAPLPPEDNPLFQPGFTYEFVKCDGYYPQPSDYYDTSFYVNYLNIISNYDVNETNYNAITHPNHSAIRISQVGSTPRKCYDNNNALATKGMVTRFNDGVYNYNTTATEKNANEINDPNLINDLSPGLYIIRKDKPDGSIEEQPILKENNDD